MLYLILIIYRNNINGDKMNGDNFDSDKKETAYLTEFISKIKPKLKPSVIFILLFSAYIIVNTFNLSKFKAEMYNVNNNANINLLMFLTTVAFVFLGILLLYIILWQVKNFHRYILFFSSVAFAVGLVANKTVDVAYAVTVLAVLFYIINYCFRRNDEDPGEKSDDGISLDGLDNMISFKTLMLIIAVLVVAFTAVIGYACVLRHKAFWSCTFDFGIFAQMFENMAKTGLQTTSVERNMQLSHFAVHFSPVYYLILPFYMIFRSPESLLIIQAAAVALGAFPLALIAKKFNLGNSRILLIVLTYLFYPAFTGGLFWDFHENKFLTVLILWLLYFIVSEPAGKYRRLIKYILICVFAAFVLTVKEDSFIYVFCIALYMISMKKDGRYSKGNIFCGIALAAASVIYFRFATWYIDTHGTGVMMWRFDMFMQPNEDGFLAIIINIIKSPALLLASLISVPEKLEFLLYMLIPLCFLPFISKRLNFIILIAPMVIMNLVANWKYQYDINYQYTYGVAALLFFLAVSHLPKINVKHIAKICVMTACFSIVLFMSKNYFRIQSYHNFYYENKAGYIETEKMLKQIPLDASVTATNFIVPHLITREKLYMADISTADYFAFETDYLVADMRYANPETYRNFEREAARYKYVKISSGVFIEIFKKAESGEGE